MIHYNTNFLVKIIVNDFHESKWCVWLPKIKILGLTIRHEGVYNDLSMERIGNDAPKNHTLKNGVIYENPECILCFSDKSEKTYYFENYDDAVKFSETFTINHKWIK